jgi:hypothetical protein
MQRKSAVIAAALTAAGLAASAGAASASTTVVPKAPDRTVTAVTSLTDRPDSGGNGYWAWDTFARTLTLHYLGDGGPAGTPYQYSATVSDKGTFKDEPGAYAPDQGGADLGRVLLPQQVSGPMAGTGSWGVFDASTKASAAFVPAVIPFSAETNPAYASPVWPELAFPAGTVFSGVSESAFDYTYQAVPVVVKGKVVRYRQHWEDSNVNSDGQLAPADGEIRGQL